MAIATALSSTLLQCEYGLFLIAFIALILSLRKWPRQPISTMWYSHEKAKRSNSVTIYRYSGFCAFWCCATVRLALEMKGQVSSRREIVFNSSLQTTISGRYEDPSTEGGMVAGGAFHACLSSTSAYILTLRIAACGSDIRHVSTASCR